MVLKRPFPTALPLLAKSKKGRPTWCSPPKVSRRSTGKLPCSWFPVLRGHGVYGRLVVINRSDSGDVPGEATAEDPAADGGKRRPSVSAASFVAGGDSPSARIASPNPKMLFDLTDDDSAAVIALLRETVAIVAAHPALADAPR